MSLSIVMVCAVLASLAVGVVVAYWVVLAMFGIFRVHSRQVQAKRAVVAKAVQVVQS